MTHKPTVLYQGKGPIKEEPEMVLVNFFENNQQILIKLKNFHYVIMLKLINETPVKALNYAKENGVIVGPKEITHHVINIEDGRKLESKVDD